MHDVGTGDGIVQNGDQNTCNKLRTPPLWGLRTHSRLLHDGSALTVNDAIHHHNGEARRAVKNSTMPDADQKSVLTFLNAL